MVADRVPRTEPRPLNLAEIRARCDEYAGVYPEGSEADTYATVTPATVLALCDTVEAAHRVMVALDQKIAEEGIDAMPLGVHACLVVLGEDLQRFDFGVSG